MTTATERTYDATIENIGPARKRVTITVPGATVAEKIEMSMGTLRETTALPGFRKGKTPMALLEKRFGQTVRDETRNQLLAEAYSTVLQEHGIEPVTQPRVMETSDELKLEPGKDLVFNIEVEVVPDVELPSFEGVEILRPIVDVADEMIDLEIKRQCTMAGEVVPVESGWQEGDRFLGPGTVVKEGEEEPFFSHDRVDVIIPGEADGGRGQVLGLAVDGLLGMVEDLKVGDTFELSVVGPEQHELEHIRGKKLNISIQIREGQRIEPASIETVVERYGMESEAMLREQIRTALEGRVRVEQQAAMREQVFEKLADSADFDLPETLTEAQITRSIERARLEMLYKGTLTAEEIEQRLADMRTDTEGRMRRRLKIMFLCHKLAKQHEIGVSEAEVNGVIAQMARQRGERPEKLRAALVQSGGINEIATQIRDYKAADKALEAATLKDIPADEWNARFKKD